MESAPSEPLPAEPGSCPGCGNLARVGALFCAVCGVSLSGSAAATIALPVARAEQAWLRVRSAAFCYLTLLVVVVGSSFVGWTTTDYFVVDLVMATVVGLFAWPLRAVLFNLLRRPQMDALAWALLLLGPPLLWGLNQGLIALVSDVPDVWIGDPVQDLRSVGASAMTIFFLVCVTPPVVEELAFRGLLLESIREPFGTLPAAIVTSALFSILHVALLSFIPLAALALVLAALRMRTGSLWPAIVGHGIFNTITLVVDLGG